VTCKSPTRESFSGVRRLKGAHTHKAQQQEEQKSRSSKKGGLVLEVELSATPTFLPRVVSFNPLRLCHAHEALL